MTGTAKFPFRVSLVGRSSYVDCPGNRVDESSHLVHCTVLLLFRVLGFGFTCLTSYNTEHAKCAEEYDRNSSQP
jgi:hypothetical protein